ncbi:hypothetical protein CRG98_021177 [Punica granatum]|uniref:Reverse transcriptase Ty1/copia-type domain-containing protein n=1 Tax=Punica granatum TaxID=22663 RepID=A0A2I0JQ39_PUNGR|nr:hypothetical protein CRG98_021177 [Punica granatum]
MTQDNDVLLVDNDEPTTYAEAMTGPNSEKWLEAVGYEMESIYTNQVWTLVDPPKGVKPIGFAAYYDYEIWQMDVKTTFLNGRLLEDVYMTPPEGFVDPQSAEKVCNLQQSIYGLKQASKSWNLRFDDTVKEFDFIKNEDEPCVYKKFMKTWLGMCFSMKDLGEATYVLGERHWIAVKNIIKYLRRTKEMFLVYGGKEELVVRGYTDASFQSDKDDSRSQSRYVFCINGGAVSWKSSKQETIAYSTTEAEYIAASNTAKEAVWIKKFVTEIAMGPSIADPVELYYDNNGAIAQAKEPRSHQRSKHILRRFHLIRKIVDRGDVKICRIPTDKNLADPLTKSLVQRKHEAHTRSLGIRDMPNWL